MAPYSPESLDRFVSKAMDFFEILAFDADQPG
jgi:hypothetical protein